nr:isochorismatase family protein [Streptomyces roseochromogenus]
MDERIVPAGGDIAVREIRYGSASTTDLHQQLSDRGIGTLVLAGISTRGVVLSPSSRPPIAATASSSCPTASPTPALRRSRCSSARSSRPGPMPWTPPCCANCSGPPDPTPGGAPVTRDPSPGAARCRGRSPGTVRS